MERRLTGFIIGIVSSLFWPQVPSIAIALFILVVALYLVQRQPFLSGIMIGVCYCALNINFQFSDLAMLKLQNSSISGTIISLPEQRKYNNRFFFKLSSIESQSGRSKSAAIILVYWPGQHDLSQGQRLKITVKTRPVHGLLNQGGFNYQKWLISKGVVATAKVISGEIINPQASWRSHIAKRVQQQTVTLAHGRFIRALALADKQAFTTSDWQLFTSTGTSHLFAISGLHLSLVFGLAYLVLNWLMRMLIPADNILLHQWCAVLISVIALSLAFGYSYLAGFSLPTVRALVMLTVVIGAKLLMQRVSLVQLIIYCLVGVLWFDPLAVLAISFWLSFCAVLSILLLFYLLKRQHKVEINLPQRLVNSIYQLMILQVWLFVTMLGLQLLFFGGLTLIAPIANLVAVPVISLLVLPLIIVAMVLLPLVSISSGLFEVADNILMWLIRWLDWLNDWPLGWVATNQFEGWLIALAAGVLIIFMLLFELKKWIGLSIILIIALSPLALATKQPSWSVHFIDVGQGNSGLIVANGRAIVVDTGKSGITTLSEMVVLPLMRYLSIEQMDYLVLSHQDNDHSGGWHQLISHYPQATLISNWPDRPTHAKVVDCHQLQEGDLSWQGLTISFFMVPNGFVANENDNSCVIRISDGHHSVLFTGDISKKTEQHLVTHAQGDWQSTILQVPHHGSKTSSSDALLKFVAPHLAVVSAGRFNRWHFPAPTVLSRYNKHGVRVETTANSGQVTVDFYRDDRYKIRRYRQEIAPFWYNNLR